MVPGAPKAKFQKHRRVEGGGILGFGCGFILAFLIGIAIWLPTSRIELSSLLVAAVIIGVIAARYGDSFFSKVLEKARWIFWW